MRICHVSPSVAADTVWAIPARAQLVRAARGRQRADRQLGVLHQRPGRGTRHAARQLRIHVSACGREDYEPKGAQGICLIGL